MVDMAEPDPDGGVRPLRDTLSQLRLRELLTEVQDRVEQIITGRKISMGTTSSSFDWYFNSYNYSSFVARAS